MCSDKPIAAFGKGDCDIMRIKLAPRFFNPLVSVHKNYYIELLLLIERTIESEKKIAIRRDTLLNQLHRSLEKSNIYEDVSDEVDYDAEGKAGNRLMDDVAYILRTFIRSGWIDLDESGDYASDLIFITHTGKELTQFLKRLINQDDQSGYVISTYSNLTQVHIMPDNGFVCIKNAYESTRGLLTSLEMMYSKIKTYYAEQLEHTHPEEILKAHFDGYIHDIIDKVLFPLKVDDSIDRFRGPILDEINEILSNTALLNGIILAATQTKRIAKSEDGHAIVLDMLNFMKNHYDNIEDILEQLDEKNNTYTRVTRQKLTYMLNMDNSIKGNIISIIKDSKDNDEDFWVRLSKCAQIYDVKNISDDSFYTPRKQREIVLTEPLEIEHNQEVDQAEINRIVDTYGAKFTRRKVNGYAAKCLENREQISSEELGVYSMYDYLMSIFLATNSNDYKCDYEFELCDGTVKKAKYHIPNFNLKRKAGK